MSESFRVKKATPVMFVDVIEPCVEFWRKLGFEKSIEIPEGDRLGFVGLVCGGVELMYQSRASVKNDVAALAQEPSRVAIFVEVADLDEAERRVEGAPVVFPRRETFYGSQEIAVREPAGNVVTLAQFPTKH